MHGQCDCALTTVVDEAFFFKVRERNTSLCGMGNVSAVKWHTVHSYIVT